VTARRARWISLLWPLVLLVIFAGTFRRTASTHDTGVDVAQCDALTATRGPADIGAYERCLALDPANAEILTDLGRAYESQQRADRAEAVYRRALEIDPHNGDLHVRLGELLLRRGDRGAARREAEDALRWRPNGLAATQLAARAAGGASGPDR
jgi:cytochrome c-type biogenesis protein CcmH/NrfG